MTVDELTLIFEIGKAPLGLVPAARHLPTAERLRERGVLTRSMCDGQPVYTASAQFAEKAGKLARYQLDAAEQGSLN